MVANDTETWAGRAKHEFGGDWFSHDDKHFGAMAPQKVKYIATLLKTGGFEEYARMSEFHGEPVLEISNRFWAEVDRDPTKFLELRDNFPSIGMRANGRLIKIASTVRRTTPLEPLDHAAREAAPVEIG